MGEPSSDRLTELLNTVGQGPPSAHRELWSLIYSELHHLAEQQMADEAAGRTLQPTALVHEAYLRLMGNGGAAWASRQQFFSVAAEAMRHIRVDYARKRRALKRGGQWERKPLVDDCAVFDEDQELVLAVNEALTELERTDPRKAELVKLRYFAGLTVEETARLMGLAPRTVDKEWRFTKAWLRRELSGGQAPTGDT